MSDSGSTPTELRATFAAIRRWQAITRLVTVVAVVAVTSIFLIFVMTTKTKVEGSFTQERVKAAVEGALPLVQPVAVDAIQRLAEEVVPVYQRMAAERFSTVRDSLGSRALVRLERLPEDAGKLMATRLDESLRRVIQQIEPEFRATFPALADESKRDLLIAEFFRAVEARNEELAAEVDALRVNEMSRVRGILDRFALPPDEAAPGDEQLKKELVRTLLLLAMQKLEEWDTGGGEAAPAGAVPAGAVLPAGQTLPPGR